MLRAHCWPLIPSSHCSEEGPYSHFTHRARKKRSQEAPPPPPLLRATGPHCLSRACGLQGSHSVSIRAQWKRCSLSFSQGKRAPESTCLATGHTAGWARTGFNTTKAHAAPSMYTAPFCSREMAIAGEVEATDTVRSAFHVRTEYGLGIFRPPDHSLSSFGLKNMSFPPWLRFGRRAFPLSHGCQRYGLAAPE